MPAGESKGQGEWTGKEGELVPFALSSWPLLEVPGGYCTTSEEPYEVHHRPFHSAKERGKHSSIGPISHWSKVISLNFNSPHHSKLYRHELQVGSPGHPMTQLQRSRRRKQEARDADLQWSLARLPLRRAGWSLQRTGGHSCGWHKKWVWEDLKWCTRGVQYLMRVTL